MNLEKLYSIIANRLKNDNSNSYVCSLAKKGKKRMIQKVGEEAIEVVIAMQDQNRKRQISEMADLIFHMLVLLNTQKISLEEIFAELEKRSQKSE